MLVEDAAKAWGISSRSVYRMIKDGTLPTSIKARDRPVVINSTRYDVDDALVQSVKHRIQSRTSSPVSVRKIIKSLKEGGK